MLETILSRKSIRKYTSGDVKESDLKDCLQAGMAAPSAGNAQPWHFIVVDDTNVLYELEKSQEYAPFLKDVHKAIVVCADLNLERFDGYWVIDCSAAVQNMLLALHSKGLGSVWVGIYPMMERVESTKRILGLPDSVMPHSLIPIGYPAEVPENNHGYHEERVHRNRFENK